MGLIVHGSYINGSSKKILVWGKWVIQDSECHILSHNFGSVVRIVLGAKRDMETWADTLLNKGNQEVHENVFSCFLRKNLICGNFIFSGHFLMFDWVWSKLSHATVTNGSLKSQDMIKILKQPGRDLSGKRLCGRYCTQILCDVYVWRSIFNIRLLLIGL